MTKMNDSGQRETFESGAVRDSDEGKPHPELISYVLQHIRNVMRRMRIC